MGMKHNVVLPNNHFNKSNKVYKMAFNKAGQKTRRANLRKQKAIEIFPRPLRKLQPVVSCQSQRYNHKMKLGKGFNLQELEKAGMKVEEARKLRIRVDLRRKSKSQESIDRNAERLLNYKNSLVFFKNDKEMKESKVQQFKAKIGFEKKIPKIQIIGKNDIQKFSI